MLLNQFPTTLKNPSTSVPNHTPNDESLEADNKIATSGNIDNEKEKDNYPSSDTTTDPYTFQLGNGCQDIGDSFAMFHYPDTASKDSLTSFDVYVGHIWDGIRTFSNIDIEQCTFKLFQSYGKAPFSLIDDYRKNHYYTEVAEIKNFNTSAYDVKTNLRKNTLTFKNYIPVNVKGLFDLEEGECGYLKFSIDIRDKDNNEVDASIGGTCTWIYFILEDGVIKIRNNTLDF